MKLVIEAEVAQRRGGMKATATQLDLTGHGETEEAALASLRRSAAAWILGLTLDGTLDAALTRRGVRCVESGEDGLQIELKRVRPRGLRGKV